MIHTWMMPPSTAGKKKLGKKEQLMILLIAFGISLVVWVLKAFLGLGISGASVFELLFGSLYDLLKLLCINILIVTAVVILITKSRSNGTSQPFYAYIEDCGILYYAQCYPSQSHTEWQLAQNLRVMRTIQDVFRVMPNVQLLRIDGVSQIIDQHNAYTVQCWGRPVRLHNGQPIQSRQREHCTLQVPKQMEQVGFLMQRFSLFLPRQNTAMRRR